MLRHIPAAASFTFETHEVYFKAIGSLTDIDTSRTFSPDWYFNHAGDSVRFFEGAPNQAFARDCAKMYAAGALSVLHRVEHK